MRVAMTMVLLHNNKTQRHSLPCLVNERKGWEMCALHSTELGRVAEEGDQICFKANCGGVAFFFLTVQIAIE